MIQLTNPPFHLCVTTLLGCFLVFRANRVSLHDGRALFGLEEFVKTAVTLVELEATALKGCEKGRETERERERFGGGMRI